MHILFLTDNFPPEVNAPASRTFEHCREWVKAGHHVTVVTGAPNFPRGKVYEGYTNKIWQRESVEGIDVVRVWTYITANEGFFRRTLDYLSFMVAAIFAAPFIRRVDVVVGTSPQFFTACAAYVVSRLKRVPWIFELRDIWPESIRAVGAMRDSFVLDILERIELLLYHRATRIISVTNAFKNALTRRGVRGEKIDVITNGVDISRFNPRTKDEELLARYDLEGKFVAGYIGTHGMAHGLETLLEAASILQDAPDSNAFRFVFLGDGACKEALVARACSDRLKNVLFFDSVPKNEVVRYWSILDASIIHLRKTDLFLSVIPSKMFECMGMGIPILHGVAGESAEIVQREGVGLTFEPENAESLIEALRRLRDQPKLLADMQANGPRSALKYDRTNLALNMLRILENVAGTTSTCGASAQKSRAGSDRNARD